MAQNDNEQCGIITISIKKQHTMLWKHLLSLDDINGMSKNTLGEALGIEFIEVGPDYLKAKMPVDGRTVQPFRILHGGASGALAETLGSVASVMCLDDPFKEAGVGVELSCSHLKSALEGSTVVGTARPYRVGKKMQVWNIGIHSESGDLICVSRLSVAVIPRKG